MTVDRYLIRFERFVDEVHLVIIGPECRMRAELNLDEAAELLKQLARSMVAAADWQPVEGLAGILK